MADDVPEAREPALRLLNPAQRRLVLVAYKDLIKKITRELIPGQVPKSLSVQAVKLIEYNISGGKCIRLQMAVLAFQHFAPDAESEDLVLASVLGWISEIIHGLACIIDDVIDDATQRRGRTCWHLLPEVGRNFALDSHLMLQLCDLLLQSYFSEKPYYARLLKVYNEMKLFSLLGENMDSRTTANMLTQDFSDSLYKTICDYKTSHYTFYFPVAAALTMRPAYDLDYGFVKDAAYFLGYFFQVQDDYLDVFGDPLVTGKIGSDIQERKCTWLIVAAMQRADEDQRQILKEKYGSTDDSDVDLVKRVFEQVGIRGVFQQMNQAFGIQFEQLLDNMPPTAPTQLYQNLFNVLANRQN